MNEIQTLLSERSRQSRLADEIRCSVKTIHTWKVKGRIPPWRAPEVLAAIGRLGWEISPALAAQLARVSPPQEEVGSAAVGG